VGRGAGIRLQNGYAIQLWRLQGRSRQYESDRNLLTLGNARSLHNSRAMPCHATRIIGSRVHGSFLSVLMTSRRRLVVNAWSSRPLCREQTHCARRQQQQRQDAV